MIDICYTCGKELNWAEVIPYWHAVKTPTSSLDGTLKAFCNENCASKIGECCPIQKEPEQMTLEI